MHIQITTGRYKGQTRPVHKESDKSIKVRIIGVGFMTLPKDSPTGPYYQEVQDAK
jgi:hypothetical protein